MKFFLKLSPFLLALCFTALWALPGPSDYEHLLHIEEAKQKQREYIEHMAATHEAYRIFYRIKKEDLE